MQATKYSDFLATKRFIAPRCGKTIERKLLHPEMFEFQRDLTHWSLRKGRAALFADTGLGKTFMQLQWAKHAADRVIILAPLAVCSQTVQEGVRWDVPVNYARSQEEAAGPGIFITNYERLSNFNPDSFGAVVLDESSILKAYEGKVRTQIIQAFKNVPMRLACTATPCPNDIAEIANHAEFLGVMSRAGMLATFFVHDDDGWRLKGHAKEAFYRWMASWGMSLRKPSDLGYSDEGYELPELSIEPVIVSGTAIEGELKGITHRSKVRKQTVVPRVQAALNLIQSEPEEPWLVWCGRNDESSLVKAGLSNAVEVKGSDSAEKKAKAFESFATGKTQNLVTKALIAGFGMNFQHCARMAFVGIGDSFEQYYQAIRRCWRYGQPRPVKAYIVLSEPEQVVYQNVLRKEQEAKVLGDSLVRYLAEFEREEVQQAKKNQFVYEPSMPLQAPAWLTGESARV